MMPKLAYPLRQKLRLVPILRQVPLSQLAKRAGGSAKRRLRNLRSKISRHALANVKVRILDRWAGPTHGNKAFWQSPLAGSWQAVEARLFKLHEAGHMEALPSFIGGGLLYSSDAVIPMSLARSGISRVILADHLRDPKMLAQLQARVTRSANFGAALSAIAAFLLEPEDQAAVVEILTGMNLPQSMNVALLIDSFSTTPSAQPSALTGTVATAASRRPARHRLVIASNLEDLTRLSLLFFGARKVTLFCPTNLYGRMNLDEATRLHARPEELLIAHPRSRATRFSAAYHRLHEETRILAEEVIEEICRTTDGRLDEARPYLALSLADSLFFKGLQAVGLQEMLADPEIDQIVIVADHKPREEYLGLFAGVAGLEDDPRIEFVSLATSERSRIDFARSFPRAFHPASSGTQTISACSRPLLPALNGLRAEVSARARQPALWPPADPSQRKQRVLFLTAPDSAYNTASASYVDILNRHFELMIGIVGGNPLSIFNSKPDLPPPPAARVHLLPTLSGQDFSLLEYTLQHIMEQVAKRHSLDGSFPVTARILQAESRSLARTPLVNGLYHWERLLHWFDQMCQADMKPGVVVISPLRPAMVGMAAAAARRFAIPSLALEPHIINAEYCRYTRVMTDRYGTVSNYLANLAQDGFSIPTERIDVIGSPRLIATPSVPPDAARRMLTESGLARFPEGFQTLLFFSQPSNWEQISEVWQMILKAMAPHEGMQILLKTHPEEGEFRVSAYLSIAEKMGLSDRVQSVNAPPGVLIEAADLVLACYSATLVEAALAGRPVMSVIHKGGRYPMEQHKVVGAPQYEDEADLSAAFAEFRADPSRSIARLTRFLDDNPQFVTGPEPGLCAAIDAITKADPAAVLRPAKDLPPRLFIEGPYRVYEV